MPIVPMSASSDLRFLAAESTPASPDWLVYAIIGGFAVVFPIFWCFIVWILSLAGGWHRLAKRYAAGARPVSGESHRGVLGMVGGVSYKAILTLHFNDEGFFIAVAPFFRLGHPRLFIPWTEVSTQESRSVFWWKSIRLGIGHPVIATISLPENLVPPRPA